MEHYLLDSKSATAREGLGIKTKMAKRVLSLLLCMVMLVGLLPSSAFATESNGEPTPAPASSTDVNEEASGTPSAPESESTKAPETMASTEPGDDGKQSAEHDSTTEPEMKVELEVSNAPTLSFAARSLNIEKDKNLIPDFFTPIPADATDTSLFCFSDGKGEDHYRIYGMYDNMCGFFACDKKGEAVDTSRLVTEEEDLALLSESSEGSAKCTCDTRPEEGAAHDETCPLYTAPEAGTESENQSQCEPAFPDKELNAFLESASALASAELIKEMSADSDDYQSAKSMNLSLRQRIADLFVSSPKDQLAAIKADERMEAARKILSAQFESFEEKELPIIIANIDSMPKPELVQKLFDSINSDNSFELISTYQGDDSEPTEEKSESPVTEDKTSETGDKEIEALYAELGIPAADPDDPYSDPLGEFIFALADVLGDSESRISFLSFDAADADAYLETSLGSDAGGNSRIEKYRSLYSIVYGATTGSVKAMGNLGGSTERLDGDYVYLSQFEVTTILDGSGPFDTNDDSSAADYSERQGNDSGPSNKIVRTFDSVTYDISYKTEAYDDYDYIECGYIYYEFTIPLSPSMLSFNTGSMGWIGDKYSDLSKVPDGSDGYVLTTTATSSVLSGKRFLEPAEGNTYSMPGKGTLNCVLAVGAMANGDTVQPVFKAWMEHNETEGKCEAHDKNEVIEITPDPVQVTAQLRMNIQILPGANTKASVPWDFTSGNENALDKEAGKDVEGRLTVFGITLQLYNDNANRGLKGCAIPSGDITFDVDMKTTFKPTSGAEKDVTETYTALVWSYGGNHTSSVGLSDGRAQNMAYYSYACSAAPINSGAAAVSLGNANCYNGGDWAATKSGSTISFTVSNYEISPTSFPDRLSGAGSTGYYYNYGQGVKNIGCFSACELWLVTPFRNSESGEYVLDDSNANTNNAGSGDFYTTISDLKLSASTAAGDSLAPAEKTENQGVNGTDDTVKSQVYLTKPGTYVNTINWASPGTSYSSNDANGLAWNAPGTSYYDGKDTASPGQQLAINWGSNSNTNGDSGNRAMAFNSLLKFDASAVTLGEIKKPSISGGSYDITYLYAAKADGSNWTSDSEMNTTGIDGLQYYSSMPTGKVCVGVLLEARVKNNLVDNVPTTATVQAINNSINAQIKESAVVGQVYQTTVCSECWRLDSYLRALESGGIPSMLGNDPSNPTVRPDSEIKNSNLPSTYSKSTYENDTYTGGHNGSNTIGDSIYIMAYKASITKQVAQTKDGTGKVDKPRMEIYDLDKSQRFVDYVMSPSVLTKYGTTSGIMTKVTVLDTLPAGLTYIPNSAYYGGDYVQASKLGRQGTVTSGIQIEPVIGEDSKKNITLTWVFENVEVDKPMDLIRYSCSIDKTAENNDQFENGVYITATSDLRLPNANFGNYATESIQVSKLSAISLSKEPVNVFNDPGEDVAWKISAGNNGANEIFDSVIMETLPYNGDSSGSSFDADLVVKSWVIDTKKASNVKDWTVWYTCSEYVRGTVSTDYSYDDIYEKPHTTTVGGKTVEWLQGSIDSATGEISVPEDQVITGMVILCTLNAGQTCYSVLTCGAKSAENPLKSGDVLANTLSRDSEDPEVSKLYVISRSLEGLTWLDADTNGKRDDGETLLSGATATLMKLKDSIVNPTTAQLADLGNYLVVKNASGKDCSVPTGQKMDALTGDVSEYSTGRYMFSNLSSGYYAVRFTGSDTVPLYKYTASPANVSSVADSMDSDAAATYSDKSKLEETFITGIEMYTKEKMNQLKMATQNSSFHDSGLYDTIGFNFVKVSGSNTASPLEGASFTVYKGKHTHDDKCGGLNPAATCSFVSSQTGDETVSADVWDLDNPVCTATSGADGKVSLTGLGYGVYLLVETKAPAGYQLSRGCWLFDVKPAAAVPVTITASKASAEALPGQPNAFFQDSGVNYLPNYPKTTMPSSGGCGTTLFIFSGVLLVGLAAVLAFTPKRKKRGAHLPV